MASLSSNDAPQTTLREDLAALLQSPRELWLVYLATFFEYLGIYSFLSTLKFWLSSDHGMSDVRSGNWATYFSSFLTAVVLLVGPLTDYVGVRRMLIASFAFAAVTRLGMSLAGSETTAIVTLLAFGFAYATTSPVLQIAVQRATTARSRAFGFSLWYVSFNLAGTLVGFLIDGTRDHFRDPVTHLLVRKAVHLPLLGERLMSAHAAILGEGVVFASIAAVIVLFIRKEFGEAPPDADGALAKKPNPLAVLGGVLKDPPFWRFMFMLLLLSLVKLIFQHMHFTWPSYVTRIEGESFPVGKVWALNSLMILGLAPLGTALTRRFRPLDVLLVGAFFTAASPFVLCFGSSLPYQVAMIVVLTIGEALWSPRLYEYNVSIAPPGREATYVSLASLPFFFAKLMVGQVGARLLARYVPEHGERDPMMLWASIGAITMVGPIGMLLARNWITRKDKPAVAPAVVR